MIQDYSTKNTATWKPTRPGTYRPNVHVKDSASSEQYDVHKQFDITVKLPPSIYGKTIV